MMDRNRWSCPCSYEPHRARGAPVLRITDVRKVYGDLEAIRNVSLDVAANEFVSILGPSGCGKSTLLMMVAGIVGSPPAKSRSTSRR